MADSFRETRLEEPAPLRWLGPLAEALAEAMGARQDDELEKLKAAASFRVAEFCPDDAIAQLAVTLAIPLFPFEDPASIRARAAEAFPTWEEAGLPEGVERSLRAFGIAEAKVYNYADWPDGTDWYSKFWVTGGPTLPWTQQIWGVFIWGDSGTWGTTAEPWQINATLGQIVYWKSPQSLPVAYINNFGEGMVWGVDTWGSTTWGGSTVVWPLSNLWGADWCTWGNFTWGTGRWHAA